jgi:hypothetical protein
MQIVQVCWKCSNGGCCHRRSIGNEMVPLFALVVFCLLGACNCWRSTSQALYGAQISVIRETLRGRSTATPYESLGYLWTYPVNSGDATGLGKSITWAWDPELCGRLMPTFRERCSTLPRVFLSQSRKPLQHPTQQPFRFCSLSPRKTTHTCGCFVPQVYDRLVHRLQLGQGINAPGL